MSRPLAALFLLCLLWLQLGMGQWAPWGLDWSLCGLLMLSLHWPAPGPWGLAMGLGLLRDSLSVAPLGSQALALMITARVMRLASGMVFVDSPLVAPVLYFFGYLFYQFLFLALGKAFGFLGGDYQWIVLWSIPRAAMASLFGLLFTLMLPMRLRRKLALCR